MPNPLVIPNNYGLATYIWTHIPSGTRPSVTMGFFDNAGSANATAAATNHRSALTGTGAPCAAVSMSTQWRFEGVTCIIRNSSGVLVPGQNLTSITGTLTAPTNAQPVFAPYVVSKTTLFAGRQYRGRMYVPFLQEDENTVDPVGIIGATQQVAEQNKWNAYFTAVTTGGAYVPYLLHAAPKVGSTPSPTAIQSLFVRGVCGVQRRRRARGA